MGLIARWNEWEVWKGWEGVEAAKRGGWRMIGQPARFRKSSKKRGRGSAINTMVATAMRHYPSQSAGHVTPPNPTPATSTTGGTATKEGKRQESPQKYLIFGL